jgi:GNAT superfamily N-acetyltransferase
MIGGNVQQIKRVSDELRKECYYIADEFCNDAEYLHHVIRHDVNELRHVMFAHFMNNQVYGFIKGSFSPLPNYVDFSRGLRTSRIEWLYVRREHHRGSIGGRLLAAYADCMKAQGVKSLHVFSAKTDQAKEFYTKHGFEIIGWNNLMGKML